MAKKPQSKSYELEPRSGFAATIRAVRTPLGLFALVALVVDVAIVAVAHAGQPQLVVWALALLALTVVLVFVISLFQPGALYHPDDLRYITVSVSFPAEEMDVELDSDKCRFEIRDRNGHRIAGHLVPWLGPGGWTVTLALFTPTDVVELLLVDSLNRKWAIRPFSPYQAAHTARTLRISA